MAVRSHTSVFMFMRNNAIKNRNCLHDQEMSDRAAFLAPDVELQCESGSLPPWLDQMEECQYALSKLNTKISDLDQIYKKNLRRPTLNDSTEDQHQIEVLTNEITRIFNNCNKLVDGIKNQRYHGNAREQLLAQNVMSSLVASLQNATNSYIKTQNDYLNTSHSIEERSKQFLNLDQDFQRYEADSEMSNIDQVFCKGSSFVMSELQLLLLEEDNTRQVEEREEEVRHIVKSVIALNETFKSLAHLVSTQGTVLDRIDYNLENVSVQVQQGFQQLQRAESYQKKNRKMKCILCLSIVTVIMFILLVFFKLV